MPSYSHLVHAATEAKEIDGFLPYLSRLFLKREPTLSMFTRVLARQLSSTKYLINSRSLSTTTMVAGEEAQKNANLSDRIIWVDCEMTGLDVDRNRLVEIACIVTDGQLKQLAEFGPVAIQQPPEVMRDMSEWCQETFAKNGLLERIKKSEHTEQAAEQMVS